MNNRFASLVVNLIVLAVLAVSVYMFAAMLHLAHIDLGQFMMLAR